MRERPAIGTRVAAAGGFRGTVADVAAFPELVPLLARFPDRVFVAWDGASVAGLVPWAELEPLEG